eukprot:12909844-Prorocentrum_lima.AAC.1
MAPGASAAARSWSVSISAAAFSSISFSLIFSFVGVPWSLLPSSSSVFSPSASSSSPASACSPSCSVSAAFG